MAFVSALCLNAKQSFSFFDDFYEGMEEMSKEKEKNTQSIRENLGENERVLQGSDITHLKESIIFRVYITIDDGPTQLFPYFLDLLERNGHVGNFFFIGSMMKRFYREMKYHMVDAINRWHVIGNHSWSHPNFQGISLEKAKEEVQRTDDYIMECYSNAKPNNLKQKYFRYPYGNRIWKGNEKNFEEFLLGRSYALPVFWNNDTCDWKKSVTYGDIVRKILQCKKNDIILIHEREKTFEACDLAFQELKVRGIIWEKLDYLF